MHMAANVHVLILQLTKCCIYCIINVLFEEFCSGNYETLVPCCSFHVTLRGSSASCKASFFPSLPLSKYFVVFY